MRNLSVAVFLSALVLGLMSCGSSSSSGGSASTTPAASSSGSSASAAPSGGSSSSSGSNASGGSSGAAGGNTLAAAVTGKQVFAAANCGSCHTLAAAGSTGQVGPNLDNVKPTVAVITSTVESGDGPMPSFAKTLTPKQVAAVAKFVSTGS